MTAKCPWNRQNTTAIECIVKGKHTMVYVTVWCEHHILFVFTAPGQAIVSIVPVVLLRISQAFLSPYLHYFLLDQILKEITFTDHALGDLKYTDISLHLILHC